MSIRQYPFPYVPNSLIAVVDGTVQPVTETDPEAGTFELPDDPLDATVMAYARISPDAVPSPPESDGTPILGDPDDDWEEDQDVADADDDGTVVDDPDAPDQEDD